MPDKITFSLKDIDTATPSPSQPAGRDTTGDVPFLPDWVNDAGKGWVKAGPTRVKEGLGELVQGNFAKGTHDVIAGAGTTALPMVAARLAPVVAAAPLRTAATIGAATAAGTAGSMGAEALAEWLGATDDQADVAGDVGALVGGAAGIRGQRAVSDLAGRYGPSVKAIIAKAQTLAGRVSPDLLRTAVSRAFTFKAGVPPVLADKVVDVLLPRGTAAQTETSTGQPMLDALMRGANFDELNAMVTPQARAAVAARAPAAAPAETPKSAPIPRRRVKAEAAAPAAPAPPAAAPKTAWTVGDPDAPAWLMEGAKVGERRILSPQAIQNALGLAARRTGARLSPEQFTAAESLVRAGRAPAEAIAAAGEMQPAVAASALTAEERAVVDSLVASGKTAEEARAAIQAQRDLRRRTGAMHPRTMRREIRARVGNRSPQRE